MARFKLTIEYHGRPFVGWQRQINGMSVQQALEEAIENFSGETVTLYAAGRTDTGVHATGQVCHVDLEKETDADTVRDAINFHVRPYTVSVLQAEEVDEDFHARFSATQRVYLYKLTNRRGPLAIGRGLSWHIVPDLDTDAMHTAAQFLLGKHDFSTFRAARCQADSPQRTLDLLNVVREGETILVHARARSFLYHQVRNMVGTLKLVGEGKWSPQDVADALAATDRSAGGPTAPPEGLYLTEIKYERAF
ncbi:MAG: tRNA pseudouridine(38-40) synthase TruA [Rhodospirillales bacterium]|nr:tRNA pseudouridine(38-40) synthase TruA [Rhodospirillales bacterium]